MQYAKQASPPTFTMLTNRPWSLCTLDLVDLVAVPNTDMLIQGFFVPTPAVLAGSPVRTISRILVILVRAKLSDLAVPARSVPGVEAPAKGKRASKQATCSGSVPPLSPWIGYNSRRRARGVSPITSQGDLDTQNQTRTRIMVCYHQLPFRDMDTLHPTSPLEPYERSEISTTPAGRLCLHHDLMLQ